MGLGQRDDNVVFGRGRLELEIELAAETLAQRQPPRTIDAASEGRMDDELHAARLVEEAFEYDCRLRRQVPERRMTRAQILDQLLGRGLNDTKLLREPAQRGGAGRVLREVFCHRGAKPRDRLREFVRATWRLAEPERDGRRHAMRILDADDAALHALDLVTPIAKLKYVTCEALDREVFVHRADDVVL